MRKTNGRNHEEFGEVEQPRGRPKRQPLERKTYSIDETSELLGLSRNTTFELARENKLPVPVVRVGKRLLVVRAALDRFLSGEAAA